MANKLKSEDCVIAAIKDFLTRDDLFEASYDSIAHHFGPESDRKWWRDWRDYKAHISEILTERIAGDGLKREMMRLGFPPAQGSRHCRLSLNSGAGFSRLALM